MPGPGVEPLVDEVQLAPTVADQNGDGAQPPGRGGEGGTEAAADVGPVLTRPEELDARES